MPGKRNIAFLLAIFLLFGTFFSLYYFYYIPAQRNSLHQYGFSLLDRIQSNILTRNRDLRFLYSNTVRQPSRGRKEDSLDARLRKLSPLASVMTDVRDFKCARSDTFTTTSDTTARFAWDNGWKLVYPMSIDTIDKDKRVYVAMSVADLLEPAFAYRKEFFESFLLVRACESASFVVYGADAFGMRQDMNGDSLLLRQKGGGFPQTTDITLRGMPYKLFTWSFLLERQPVVLCGVVKGGTYYATIHTIPLKIVYPVIIALLLVLLSLPFLKLYFVSRKEELRTRDFALAAASVAIGSAMMTLIIIHVLLLLRSGTETRRHLRGLAQQIDSAVSRELMQAGKQLAFFDRQLQLEKDVNSRVRADTTAAADSLLVQTRGKDRYIIPWIGKGQKKEQAYYYFNRMSWLDSTGLQRWKVQIDDPATIKFIDVSNRQYYKAFKDLPRGRRADEGLMVMEPVNSWTSGDFEINISQRSQVQDARAVVMSTHLYSLQNTILPPGYGYCLMDGEGDVYTHSDMRKSLKENFFDETGRLRAIKEAVTSHQDTVLHNILLYSKPHSIYIRPLKQPPLFLVTFYNEGYFLAIHLRILAFALLFLTCSALLVLLSMAVLYWKPNRHPLFAPADYSPWMLPKPSLLPYYKAGSLFMALYLLVMLFWTSEYDPYLLFFITCLTPVNIFSTLAALQLYFDEPGSKDLQKGRVVALVFLQGVLTFLCGYWGDLGWQDGSLFYYFQGGLFIALLVIIFYDHIPELEARLGKLPRWYEWVVTRKVWKRLHMGYLEWHALFIFLVTLCIASLPASLFTWFAQNHEIRQSVKKGQLYLATQLAQRKSTIVHFLRYHDPTVLPSYYIDTVAYRKGIYTIYKDTITRPHAVDSAQHAGHKHKKSTLYIRSEDLYLETVNSIIPNYNDPLFYPALRKGSFDKRWQWDSCWGEKVELTWHAAREGMFARDRAGPDTANASSLLILSVPPVRYVMIASQWVLLVIIGALLAFGIASLIRTTIYRFFSLRFVHWQETRQDETTPGESVIQPGGFLEKRYATTSYREKIEVKGAACLRDYFVPPTHNQAEPVKLKDVETYEALVMQQAASCKLFFDAVWAACSEEDKLLLMNLAQYGVINYKNMDGIHRLIKNDLVIVQDERLHLLSPGFRYYILTRADQPEEMDIKKKFITSGRWHQVRIPLLVIFLLIGIFLFITQEEAFKKVGAILTSVTGVVSLLIKFVSDASNKK